jgi:hypothetical protein
MPSALRELVIHAVAYSFIHKEVYTLYRATAESTDV